MLEETSRAKRSFRKTLALLALGVNPFPDSDNLIKVLVLIILTFYHIIFKN